MSLARLIKSCETNNELSLDSKEYTSKVVLTLLQVPDVAARQSDTNFVDFGGGDGGTRSIVILFSTFSDVTHLVLKNIVSGDWIKAKL